MSFKSLFARKEKWTTEEEVNRAKAIDERISGRKFVLEIKNLNLWAGKTADNNQILKNINIRIPEYSVVAIIGPSGSGKSSLLRTINRTNFDDSYIYKGSVNFYGRNILENYPLEYLRSQIGTVMQKPIMFPMSIRENILFALKSYGITNSSKLEIILERSLREAHLWDEVKNRLNAKPEDYLSIGQQQRLCIARAIALQPKVLLMDEPTSALDLKASRKIEDLIRKITKNKMSTIILISHSLSQVRRVSDYTIFIKNGAVIEQGRTGDIFNNPIHQETKDFVGGIY
ncbi:phosphate import ATP-binding protein PstB 3 [Candidatus Mycoplasma haematohominis]|uniref:Phosphate import ATP-binding protein PstB 3 n=1 Tax=Candidatus Mycoplasma haematohominis TaxID=1494318 RepID=A0A478FQP0_9MOLU|nr:phosphate import ATP-binding protein PstB 3 [Candidatus Mycoplasma haemohominis]